jgi:hypothetical protein
LIRAVLDRRSSARDLRAAGDQDHRYVEIAIPDGSQQAQAVDARHLHVADHAVERGLPELGQGVLAAVTSYDAISAALERAPGHLEHCVVVIHDEQRNCVSRR